QKTATIKYQNKVDKGVSLGGTTFNYTQIVNIKIDTGNNFSQAQERSGAKVALIGQTVIAKLFPNQIPLGESILVGNDRFTIIGTLAKRGSVFGLDQDNTIVIPITVAQKQFSITNVNVIYISAKNPELVTTVK